MTIVGAKFIRVPRSFQQEEYSSIEPLTEHTDGTVLFVVVSPSNTTMAIFRFAEARFGMFIEISLIKTKIRENEKERRRTEHNRQASERQPWAFVQHDDEPKRQPSALGMSDRSVLSCNSCVRIGSNRLFFFRIEKQQKVRKGDVRATRTELNRERMKTARCRNERPNTHTHMICFFSLISHLGAP